jgi:putative peptide zinc metalloprotease protein
MTLQLRPTFSESWYRVTSLKPKLRAGAQISRQFYRGERWYVVRDPAGNQYHRLSDAAYKFVGLLDGHRTIGEAWELVGGQLADDAPTQPEVIQILSQLYSANLIETNISPDATVLLRRHKRMMMHKAKGRLMNILFPRIPLWDLDWFLKLWLPVLRPMLSVIGLFVWLAVIGVAIFLAAPHWSELVKQGEDSLSLYQNPENALILYVAFAAIKFIHELGHGFMCRRFGGEVHELGIMFLVLFPAPYVDASSAWSFPNKWHRFLVGAGGMIFELFVAAICCFFWLATKDSGGVLPLFLYNVMLIASFSTVVFNANPLLRYDGYYMLSDLLEIPNLQHRSREYSLSLIKRHLFRVKWSQPLPAPSQRPWLLAYFCLSGPYRVMVGIFIMIMVLYQLPEQVKFFIVPAYKTFTYLTIEPELHRKRGIAWAWTTAFAAAAVVVLAFIRFPQNVRAEAFLRPAERESVFPKTPGYIEKIEKQDGQQVAKGDTLLVLRNDELEAEINKLTALVGGLEVQLQAAQADDPVLASSVGQQLNVQRSELARSIQRRDDLIIKAPIAGQFVAPSIAQQVGRYVSPGEQQPLGIVSNTTHLIGYAMINQGEIELIKSAENRAGASQKGYTTQLRLVSDVGWLTSDGHPISPLDSRLVPGSVHEVRSAAMTTAGGGEFAADPRDPSGRRLSQEEFEFQVTLNNPQGFWQPDQRAYVRIQMDKGTSIVEQGWRRLNQLIQTTKTS